MKYFEVKEREDGTKFTCLKAEYQDKSLHTIIRDIHDNAFPSDQVYALIAEIFESFAEYESREDFEESEVGYFIYTSDAITFFRDAQGVIERRWDELSDYLCGVEIADLTPSEYQTRVSNAFVAVVRNQLADYAEGGEFWTEDNQEGENQTSI